MILKGFNCYHWNIIFILLDGGLIVKITSTQSKLIKKTSINHVMIIIQTCGLKITTQE